MEEVERESGDMRQDWEDRSGRADTAKRGAEWWV